MEIAEQSQVNISISRIKELKMKILAELKSTKEKIEEKMDTKKKVNILIIKYIFRKFTIYSLKKWTFSRIFTKNRQK